jgi:hypothetical protein
MSEDNKELLAWFGFLLIALVMILIGASSCDIRSQQQAQEMAKLGYCWQRDVVGNYAYRPCKQSTQPVEGQK